SQLHHVPLQPIVFEQVVHHLLQALTHLRRHALQQVDGEKLEELLGPEASDQLEKLRQTMKLLEDEGYLEKRGDSYELTAKAIRRIGQKALRDIFGRLKKDAFGKHETEFRGAGGERSEETKSYQFGDPFLVNLEETLMNSLVREGAGTPMRIKPDDFSVYRTEQLTESSIVLMVDMSRSMLLRGCFLAAKKVSLALNSLIKSQFPNDNLYIVLFSQYAREVRPDTLTELSWDEEVYGTNLQHALMLGRKLLGKHKMGNRQIIVITDGEPTAHLEGETAQFAYPPTQRTVVETLKEVQRCTRDRIVINTFMLERSRPLVEFVNQMSRINKGRAFFCQPEQLGEYVLVDYVSSKRKKVA
ncbi:MAG TPA: VWA domain-containing protein, partial [Chloroflexota bacterium]|nr:VWA domain-containing protein [Chloroflexota bacterium]